MTDAPLAMTAALHRSSLDARRGVVRLHPQVLAMLKVRAWDPLRLEGDRVTAALAAEAGPRIPRSTILLDDLTCANAGVSTGQMVKVSRATVAEATEIVVAAPADDPRAIDPYAVRFALLGKILTTGDQASLMPQDFVRPDGAGPDLPTLIGHLTKAYGQEWQDTVLTVSSTTPSGLVSVSMETVVLWEGHDVATSDSATRLNPGRPGPPTREDLPGHEDVIDRLRELLDLGFNHADLLNRLGSEPQMGVLLTGPAGSGKVAVVEAVAHLLEARLNKVWAPSLARLPVGDATARLKEVVAQAETSPPAVVLIEDVDAIAAREEPGPLLTVLLEEVRAAVAKGAVAVICTSARPDATSPQLRAPGVLDQEIEISLPNRDDRRRILEVLVRGLPLAADVPLQKVAGRTPGFVAADLRALCREASLRAAQRAIDTKSADHVQVEAGDFAAALEVVKPSSMEGISLDIPNVTMADLGDMATTKTELTESVLWAIKYPDRFESLGVKPASGVLLYGPPGCGKTYIVKALANDADANFIAVKGAELLSKWVGESERGVRELFRRARSAAPTIVFFDELDALAPARGKDQSGTTDRVVAQLLTELDGIEDLRGVFAIAATNRPDLIDSALLRPGRLERLVYVPPPDADARGAILQATAKDMPIADDVYLEAIGGSCTGFSAADLEALARQAALAAMRENLKAPSITAAHFEAARKTVSPSLNAEQVARTERFAAPRTA